MHILVPSGGCRRGDSIEGVLYKGLILDKCQISFLILSTFGLSTFENFGLWLFFLVCLLACFLGFFAGVVVGVFF